MSKFFQAGGDDSLSGLSSSDEESLYGSSSEDLSSQSDSESDMSPSDASESESGSESDADSDSDANQPQNQYLRNKFLKGQDDSDSDSDDERVVVKSAKTKVLDEIVSHSTAFERELGANDFVSSLATFDKLVKVQAKANQQYQTVPLEFVRALSTLEAKILEVNAEQPKLSPSMSKALNTLKQRGKKAAREYEARLKSYRASPEQYAPGAPVAAAPTEALNKSKAGAKASAPRTTLTTGAVVDESELSASTVFRTLLSVTESRGRKSTDRQEQVQLLERQLELAEGAYPQICVLLMLIPLRFDLLASPLASSSSAGSLNAQHSLYAGADFGPWEKTLGLIQQLFAILEQNPLLAIYELAPEPEDREQGPVEAFGRQLIPGSLTTLVERLDDEHSRILATCDPHTTEYIERLRSETVVVGLLLRAQCHQEQTLKSVGTELTDSETYCRLLARRIDHLYYKPPIVLQATESAAWQNVPSALDTVAAPRASAQLGAVQLISELCRVLYAQPNASLRARAMLSLIYQYALNDEYYRARDLMLMSHLQSQIHAAEPSTQVLFNRALVQVGLCAFRAGLVSDALQNLQEICSASRLKELLGQGQARQTDAGAGGVNQTGANLAANGVGAPELLPYHMHINLELVECVYLTASMLTEVPYLASISDMRSAQLDLKRRAQNRQFRRMLEQLDRQVFNGPSETTRDFVIQAAKSLQTGDWRQSLALLNQIKVWSLLSLVSDARAKVMAMLEHKLKIEGLRTYLLAYGLQTYHAISLAALAEDFALSTRDVKQLVVKMIASDEIAALLDSSSQHLVFRAEADVARLKTLALALADKATALSDRNERLAAEGHISGPTNPKRMLRARN